MNNLHFIERFQTHVQVMHNKRKDLINLFNDYEMVKSTCDYS